VQNRGYSWLRHRQPCARNYFIPSVKDYEFGYSPYLSTAHDINFGELVLSKLKRTIGDSAWWNIDKCVSEENTEIQNQHLRLDLLPFYNTLQSKFRVWTIQYVQRKPVQATKVKNNLKNFAPWRVRRVIGQKCLMKGLINVSHMRDGEKANMSRPKTQKFIMPLIPFTLLQTTSKFSKWCN
jgi:hypothetical protein